MLKLIARAHAKFLAEDDGATSIEYAMIAVGISIVIAGAVRAVGGDVSALFTRVHTGFVTLSG